MVDLAVKSPFAETELPIEIGNFAIGEIATGHVLSVMPFDGQGSPVSADLEKAIGMGLPPVGQTISIGGNELFWTGQNQWFLHSKSVPPTMIANAATTDQSDGWAILSLRGKSCEDVMARLCPIDLRDFKPGQVARTEFAHMMSIILPREGGYDIWVMRSFALTALHHLTDAAQNLTAIKALRS